MRCDRQAHPTPRARSRSGLRSKQNKAVRRVLTGVLLRVLTAVLLRALTRFAAHAQAQLCLANKKGINESSGRYSEYTRRGTFRAFAKQQRAAALALRAFVAHEHICKTRRLALNSPRRYASGSLIRLDGTKLADAYSLVHFARQAHLLGWRHPPPARDVAMTMCLRPRWADMTGIRALRGPVRAAFLLSASSMHMHTSSKHSAIPQLIGQGVPLPPLRQAIAAVLAPVEHDSEARHQPR